MEDSNRLLHIFPLEVWEVIMANATPQAQTSAWFACQFWKNLMDSRKTSIFFPAVFSHLYKYLPLQAFRTARLVCKHWEEGVSSFLESGQKASLKFPTPMEWGQGYFRSWEVDMQWIGRKFQKIRESRHGWVEGHLLNQEPTMEAVKRFQDAFNPPPRKNPFLSRSLNLTIHRPQRENNQQEMVDFLTSFGKHVWTLSISIGCSGQEGEDVFYNLYPQDFRCSICKEVNEGVSAEYMEFQRKYFRFDYIVPNSSSLLFGTTPGASTVQLLQFLWKVLELLPNLRKLQVKFIPFGSSVEDVIAFLDASPLPPLPQLQSLHFSSTDTDARRRFELAYGMQLVHYVTECLPPTSLGTPPFAETLKSLTIRLEQHAYTASVHQVIREFLLHTRKCTSLECLEMEFYADQPFPEEEWSYGLMAELVNPLHASLRYLAINCQRHKEKRAHTKQDLPECPSNMMQWPKLELPLLNSLILGLCSPLQQGFNWLSGDNLKSLKRLRVLMPEKVYEACAMFECPAGSYELDTLWCKDPLLSKELDMGLNGKEQLPLEVKSNLHSVAHGSNIWEILPSLHQLTVDILREPFINKKMDAYSCYGRSVSSLSEVYVFFLRCTHSPRRSIATYSRRNRSCESWRTEAAILGYMSHVQQEYNETIKRLRWCSYYYYEH